MPITPGPNEHSSLYKLVNYMFKCLAAEEHVTNEGKTWRPYKKLI
jgi:hypothetical protein